MLVDNNDDGVTVTADVPDNTELPPSGYFGHINVHNWHGIRHTDSRIMSDATVPSMVELTMVDGSTLAVWPDGTFVLHSRYNVDKDYSLKITPNGVMPNPYRH